MNARAPERLLLRVEEACEALAVSRAHLYALIAKGEVPAIRLGRRTLIPREWLEHFVRRRLEMWERAAGGEVE